MSEQKQIRKADIARHWGVTAPYLTKLVKEKSMPPFTTLVEADAWRAIHAPPKAANQKPPEASSKKPVVVAEKNRESSETTTPGGTTSSGGGGGDNGKRGGVIVDLETFVRHDKPFEVLMLEQAERVPQIAYGLFEMKSRNGEPNEISAANKNWHECSKAAAAVRNEFLDLQERSGALISLDEVMDVVGTELQAVRASMLKLGERTANQANPQDPALAKRVIDAAVDGIFRMLEAVQDRAGRQASKASA